MRSSSVWAGNDPQRPQQDLVALLRSPVFFGAAVVIVAVSWILGALNSEDWIEVAPIPVLQEREVMYLEDDGIFVFWNEGDPYGVFERSGAERVVYCAADGAFVSSEGAVFDARGRARSGEPDLPALDARMDGHLVFVNGDRSESLSVKGRPRGAGSCDPPPGGGTGIVGAPR